VVARASFNVLTLSVGAKAGAGIYDKDGNLLVRTGAIDLTTTGVKTAATTSTVPLEPGVYWVANTIDDTTAVLRAGPSTASAAIMNSTNVHQGNAANSGSAGILPATLGVISSSSGFPPAMIYFEP
ncbi:hypothetical protein LCGC14_1992300, partial [marine sediment metagenome]